jgi:hypothetical protein
MTVQAATEMWSRYGGDVSTTDGKTFNANIQRGFQVVTDPSDLLEDVLFAPNLPRLGDLYAGSSQIRVKKKVPKKISPVLWTVGVTYEGEFGPDGLEDSPLNKPPEITWGKAESEEPIDQDFQGKPIVTANNEPIFGITKSISDITVSIKRNYIGVDLPATHKYLHSVNSDVFLGFAAGLGRMTQFNAVQQYDETFGGYYTVTAGVQFRWPYNTTANKAWWSRVRHEGFMVRKTPDDEPERAKDRKENKETSQPVLLKPDGTEQTDPEQADWLEFQIYQPLPYNALGLV